MKIDCDKSAPSVALQGIRVSVPRGINRSIVWECAEFIPEIVLPRW
jgi:hypothetical protein